MRAREFAVAAHGEQRYGPRPYLYHLAAVAKILEDFGFSEEYVIAGWLHDVIEDTNATEAELESAFGERVARIVSAVSGGGDRAHHVQSIYRKIATCPDAATVKLADRIANIEACEPGDKHSFRYAREHAGFADAIEAHVPTSMWQRYLQALERSATDRRSGGSPSAN